MNGEARSFVMKTVNNPKATLHEKMDAVIVLMLSDHDRLVEVERFTKGHPLSFLSPRSRKGVYVAVFAWFWGVTWAFGDFIWSILKTMGLV